MLERILRTGEDFGAERAAQAARPLPSAKVMMNSRVVLMPTDCAMRRLSTAARTIAPQRVRSTPNQSPRRSGSRKRSGRRGRWDSARAEVELAAQAGGRPNGWVSGPR